jgi:hypothetical protein
MLDADARLIVDAVPGAIAYADSTDRGRVYACAASPRLALDENGAPQLSLLLYGHGRDARPEGGQLTLTTSLELTGDERAGLAAALAPAPPYGPVPDPCQPAATGPAPDVIAPDWLSGQVTVRLAIGLELSGRPSLSGANRCVLAASLDAGQAQAVAAAIRDGLPDSAATYSVDVAASRSSAAAAGQAETGPGRASTARFEAAVTAASRLHMELSGPLTLAPAHRGTVTSAITL